jgi:signal transduction histidine kinase
VRTVEATVTELATATEIEDIARSLHRGGLDGAEVLRLGKRLMASHGLDALELLDADGRILTSGHLEARAGDPDPLSLELALKRPGRAEARRIEVATETGLATALGFIAARPVEYGSGRVTVVGGRVIGSAWAKHLADLTGSAVAVHVEGLELARTATVELPRARTVPVSDGAAVLGSVTLELSAAALRDAKSTVLRRAIALWVGLLLLAGAASWWVSASVTRPVEALSKGASAIARGELGYQVPVAATGEVGELVTTFNTMSEDLRSAKERAAAAERIAAYQEVARRVAHEVNNSLTPIRMSMETLLAAHSRREGFDAIFDSSAGAVLEEVERLRRFVREFNEFARLPAAKVATLDLSELVEGVLSLYSSSPEGIRIARELTPGLRVRADRDQLVQVLENLLGNARQAISDSGTITVRTLALDEREVALEVEDTGKGVSSDIHSRIFEPYFTTKGEGTGLGLAIVKRIAQEHGGRVEELGEPGKGARFRFTLPRDRQPPDIS